MTGVRAEPNINRAGAGRWIGLGVLLAFGPAALLGSALAALDIVSITAAFLLGLIVTPCVILVGLCAAGAQAEATGSAQDEAHVTQLLFTTIGVWIGTWCLLGIKADSHGPLAVTLVLLICAIAAYTVGLRPVCSRLSEAQ